MRVSSRPSAFFLAIFAVGVLILGVTFWFQFVKTRPGASDEALLLSETPPKLPPPTTSQIDDTAVDTGAGHTAPESDLEAVEGKASDQLAEALFKLNDTPGVVPGELLLRFRSPSDIAALRSRASALGIQVLWSDARLHSARIAFSDTEKLATELQSNREAYEEIGPNYLMAIPGLPAEPELHIDGENAGGTVPFRDSLLQSIGADGDRSLWGDGVSVAVLDSGIETHPSLANVSISRIDLSSSSEIHGHGTAMASLIAGQQPPAAGIAPAATLLDIRVTDETGRTNTGLVAEAILQAADRRVDVINISLGSFGNSPVLQSAVDYALERNIVVVAAAGNEQMTSLAFPAAYRGVISVGAVDAANTQAYFSNSGKTLTIAAPGVGIYSAYNNDQLVMGSGTSQAAAITSGVVATLLSRGYRPAEIARVLQESATHTGAPREQVGAGVIRIP